MRCFYCETGIVSADELPCRCPACGYPLTKSYADMDEAERGKAKYRKALLDGSARYSLACSKEKPETK